MSWGTVVLPFLDITGMESEIKEGGSPYEHWQGCLLLFPMPFAALPGRYTVCFYPSTRKLSAAPFSPVRNQVSACDRPEWSCLNQISTGHMKRKEGGYYTSARIATEGGEERNAMAAIVCTVTHIWVESEPVSNWVSKEMTCESFFPVVFSPLRWESQPSQARALWIPCEVIAESSCQSEARSCSQQSTCSGAQMRCSVSPGLAWILFSELKVNELTPPFCDYN